MRYFAFALMLLLGACATSVELEPRPGFQLIPFSTRRYFRYRKTLLGKRKGSGSKPER